MNAEYPFRLGTTSFILPEDYLPNIRFLADRVDDIALLFFEPLTAMPDWIDLALKIRTDRQLSFSVHLPADVKLAATDERIREEAVRACVKVIEVLAPLAPVAYVCHANSDTPAEMSSAALASLTRSLQALGAACGDPTRICVENVDLPHDSLRAALDAAGVSICYDVGHALMAGQDVLQDLANWLPRCGVLHLHGVCEGRDHHTLDCLPTDLLSGILELYASPQGLDWRVLTLELFNRARWERSLQCFEQAWASIEGIQTEATTCR
ncbi:cobamide remodeling phosphodiesterase CbiR [Coraliomargarita algicola]|uniref:Cobamide remodeling phosphodiesterase CbiR n=1 Tax=Coraliomargarita algicola TaxID=3092156 RepID=A0ABZ0RHN7_9BACT|nr:cobamide remodeling phosphodiesterase CbiR [Coraliomargarita sp. J2-16]WPJ94613.1 cobamide remodeling phosphodiesterase CbiR [Coraliomargarita sp. J2-16]